MAAATTNGLYYRSQHLLTRSTNALHRDSRRSDRSAADLPAENLALEFQSGWSIDLILHRSYVHSRATCTYLPRLAPHSLPNGDRQACHQSRREIVGVFHEVRHAARFAPTTERFSG